MMEFIESLIMTSQEQCLTKNIDLHSINSFKNCHVVDS